MTIIPAKRVNPSATRITPITPECAGRDGTPEHRPPPMPGRSTVGTRVIPMSRKVCGVMTGWLAAASVAVAQTGGTTGDSTRPKARLFRRIMRRRAPWIGRIKRHRSCCRRCRQRRLSRRPRPRKPCRPNRFSRRPPPFPPPPRPRCRRPRRRQLRPLRPARPRLPPSRRPFPPPQPGAARAAG